MIMFQLSATSHKSGVHAWELEQALDPGMLDTKLYFNRQDQALLIPVGLFQH